MSCNGALRAHLGIYVDLGLEDDRQVEICLATN